MAFFKDPSLTDCMAYREWERTKNTSAFNWHQPTKSTRTVNQYVSKTMFADDSYCLVSSCRNKVNKNYMAAYTKNSEGISIRVLF